MKKQERRVKIEYAFNQVSPGELLSLYLGASIILLQFAPTLIYVIMVASNRYIYAASLLGFVALLTIPFGLFMVARFFQKRKGKNPKFIKKYGKKVIGSIVSLKTIDLNGSSRNQKHFTYTIEYENPENGKTITITTPAVLSYRMCLKEKDLPIKVVVYLFEGEAFADEIINPPLVKMNARRLLRFLPLLILAFMFFSSLFIASMDFEKKINEILEYGGACSALLCAAAVVSIFMEAYNPRDPLS